jgi:hypothetical protein
VVSGGHLCHGQPAPGCGDRVALAGVCLLALAQLEELSLGVVVVGDGRGWRGHGFHVQLSFERGVGGGLGLAGSAFGEAWLTPQWPAGDTTGTEVRRSSRRRRSVQRSEHEGDAAFGSDAEPRADHVGPAPVGHEVHEHPLGERGHEEGGEWGGGVLDQLSEAEHSTLPLEQDGPLQHRLLSFLQCRRPTASEPRGDACRRGWTGRVCRAAGRSEWWDRRTGRAAGPERSPLRG